MRLIKPRWETPKPPGVTGTYGDAAIAWAIRKLQLTPAAWQAYAIRNILRHDRAGNLIHRLALVSTARQNGKSVIVRVIVGWVMDEGQYLPAFAGWPEMLLAAHDANQANVVYRKVMGDLAGIPGFKEKPDTRLTLLYGLESGHLAVNRVTHIPGSARGRSAGLVAWDEVLTQVGWEMWEVLQPVVSAVPNPLMLLTSTAGDPSSVVLRRFYDRLLRIAAGDEAPDAGFYGAWWASRDPDAGLAWGELGRANPSMQEGRPNRAAVAAEYRDLPTESWRKERLNHWTETRVAYALNVGAWGALRTPDALKDVDPPYVLAVDIQPGWERATVMALARRPDGRIGAEVYRDLRAEDGPITAASLIAAAESFPQPVSAVVYDSVSGAAAEFDRHGIGAWGVEWMALKPAQVVSACMDAMEMILSGRLAVDDPLLDAQVPTVARREVGSEGAFRFTRTASGGPIDAFMALTMGAHVVAAAVPAPRIT